MHCTLVPCTSDVTFNGLLNFHVILLFLYVSASVAIYDSLLPTLSLTSSLLSFFTPSDILFFLFLHFSGFISSIFSANMHSHSDLLVVTRVAFLMCLTRATLSRFIGCCEHTVFASLKGGRGSPEGLLICVRVHSRYHSLYVHLNTF